MKTPWMLGSVLPLVVGLACRLATDGSQPLGKIHFFVSPSTATATDTLHVSLTNASTASAYYNLCFVPLEQRVDARWVPSGPSARACTMELRGLAPGRTAGAVVALDSSVVSGTYRVRTAIEWPLGIQREVVSEPFTVRP